MEYKAIMAEKKDGVAVVTINQPKTMNALTQQVFDELTSAAADLTEDESVKAIVLTGAGRVFCAGGDLNRFQEGFTRNSGVDFMEGVHTCVRAWANMKKPVIAAVNGPAMGAGLSLVLLCDLSVMSADAKVSCAFINMGLIPDCGLAYYLPRIIGLQKARELILTGRKVDAEEAERIGLVTKTAPPGEVMEEAMKLADQLAKGPAYGLRMSKRILGMSLDLSLNDLLHAEAMVQADCYMTDDSKEAVSAFIEKRPPEFKGQ